MTEEKKPAEPESHADLKEIKAEIQKLPLSEKVLAPIAVLVVVGWIFQWSTLHYSGLFRGWFETLSFFGALAVAALVGLKLFGKRPLPPNVERQVIPIASLIPVAGYLFELIKSIPQFLTVGGSLALAYISATTYWRRHIPEFAMKPLGENPSSGPAASPPPAA